MKMGREGVFDMSLPVPLGGVSYSLFFLTDPLTFIKKCIYRLKKLELRARNLVQWVLCLPCK